MSKISYCSLEEAWGDAYKKNNDNDKYDNLNKISELERKTVITNMNDVERSGASENNSIVEYNKYRFNPVNKVVKNDPDQPYTPFNESIEKKYLQDKLNFLENEFRKYKHLFDKSESSNSEDTIENFENETQNVPQKENKNNDIIDLILLIIIGLIVILVMNSIFTIGKNIGIRNSKFT